MKVAFNLSEKKKWDIQGIRPSHFKAISLTVIIIIALIGISTPLWNISFDPDTTTSFLSFSDTRSFLHAFGSHFALFCCASFIFWTKNFIPSKYQNIITIINIIGGIFVAVSAYFLLWVFGPSETLSQWAYEILFTVLAIGVAFGMHVLSKFIYYYNDREQKIADAAPELLQIAEMFKDHMAGNAMEKTMIYETVDKVLDRLQ